MTGWWEPEPGLVSPDDGDDELGSESVHLEAQHGRFIGTSETVRHVQLSCSVR
jgi:hypothetical protein